MYPPWRLSSGGAYTVKPMDEIKLEENAIHRQKNRLKTLRAYNESFNAEIEVETSRRVRFIQYAGRIRVIDYVGSELAALEIEMPCPLVVEDCLIDTLS